MSNSKKTKTKSARESVEQSEEHGLELDAELDSVLTEDAYALIDICVARALADREAALLAGMVEKLSAAGIGVAAAPVLEGQNGKGWLAIESLSALRNLVGGRFHNLKERWVEAGFPLKEHRGDKTQKFEVNKQGWVELSNWIMKQGYEARLVLDREDCLFELRSVGKE